MGEQIAKAMARWYLYHMPTFEHGKWTWNVYDMCMEIVYGPRPKDVRRFGSVTPR